MSVHHAGVRWAREERPFTYETYGRDHQVVFAGGVALPASSAVEYRGDGARPNPEELLVAAVLVPADRLWPSPRGLHRPPRAPTRAARYASRARCAA